MKRWMMMAAMVCLAMCGAAHGQKVVHAMAGTVIVANMNSMVMTLQCDDGVVALFHIEGKADPSLKFDKALEAEMHPVATAKPGEYIAVFFTEDTGMRTALAIDELSAAAPDRSAGTVAAWDKKSHKLSLGGSAAVTLSEKTVVDTPDGVMPGMKYHPNKGDRVEVKSTKADQTALFVAVAT